MLFMRWQQAMYVVVAVGDKRPHVIDAADDSAAATIDESGRRGRSTFKPLTAEPGLAEVFKRTRDGSTYTYRSVSYIARVLTHRKSPEDYHSVGTAGKFVWYACHTWSDRECFDQWLLLMFNGLAEEQSLEALPQEGLKICVTHLTNRACLRAGTRAS